MNEDDSVVGTVDPFALDVQIVMEVVGTVGAPCQTQDGCGSTCASACVSRSV